jgi:serine/threonine-protein kinase
MSSGEPLDTRGHATVSTGGVEDDERTARARARVGEWVNRKWQLGELLGTGGTAAVYAATHRNGARVAIKMLHPEFTSDSERCARFQREGYAANLVEHSGVVSIHDDGVDDRGQPFLVMELLRGASLQALLGGAPGGLPAERVLEWALSLLEILERAHAKDVLHRDIKPSNLFLDDRGRLRVLDFGLAGGVAFEASTTTVSGAILGTPAFMPPEQARGDWDAVDAKSDLWATGATLFTLLTGEHVHLARTAQEQLGMAMMVSPRSLGRANPALPAAIVELVDRALEFEPARRWSSASAMADACRALVPGAEAEPRSQDVSMASAAASFRDPRIDTQKTATLSLDEVVVSRTPRARGPVAGTVAGVVVVIALAIGLAALGRAKKPEERPLPASSSTTSLQSAPRASTVTLAPPVTSVAPRESSSADQPARSANLAPHHSKPALRPTRTTPAAFASTKTEEREPAIGDTQGAVDGRAPGPSLVERRELEERE